MSVCLSCFGILQLILTVYLILMLSDSFVNTNIRQGSYTISYKGNNSSYQFNFFWKQSIKYVFVVDKTDIYINYPLGLLATFHIGHLLWRVIKLVY